MWVEGNTLQPRSAQPFYVSMNVSGPYISAYFQATVRATELSAPAFVSVSVLVAAPKPRLRFAPTSIRRFATRGKQQVIDVVVSNIGGADTGFLNLRLARNPVISLASSSIVSNIAAGNSTVVSFKLAPSNTLSLGVADGTILFSNSLLRESLPFSLTVVSFALSNLSVRSRLTHVFISPDFNLVSS